MKQLRVSFQVSIESSLEGTKTLNDFLKEGNRIDYFYNSSENVVAFGFSKEETNEEFSQRLLRRREKLEDELSMINAALNRLTEK